MATSSSRYSFIPNHCAAAQNRPRGIPFRWPGGTSAQMVNRYQQLFPRDTHWHAEVLNERIYPLPLKLPQNSKPVIYCDSSTGRAEVAPYSTDNQMHWNWHESRLCTNVSTPIGSDSDIFFNTRGDPSTPGIRNTDDEVCACCEKHPEAMVCSTVCVDMWTNRPSPPQGSTGGCPFGTVKALSCYDCSTHLSYVKNK